MTSLHRCTQPFGCASWASLSRARSSSSSATARGCGPKRSRATNASLGTCSSKPHSNGRRSSSPTSIVSPSAYLMAWMRDQGWQLPEQAVVIPYLTRSGATGEPSRAPAHADGRVQRLAFFGRFEERKGVRPFVAGINALEPELLEGIELDFLGRDTPALDARAHRRLALGAGQAARYATSCSRRSSTSTRRWQG